MTTPRRIGGWLLLAAALVSLVSTLVLLVSGRWENALRFAIITGILLAVGKSEVPLLFAGPFAAFILVATWASVEHWYRHVDHLDLVVHLFTPGSLAAVTYFVLARRGLLPSVRDGGHWSGNPAVVLWVTMAGTLLAVVWEYYEWIMEQVSPAGMIVGYGDTVADLAAGMLGSAVAGALVLGWARRHSAAGARPTEAATV